MTAAPGRPDPAEGSVVAVRTSSPHVVLTFDDGPEPGGTDAVLAALDELGATATFFVLVSRARRSPALLAEVVAAGHEIGLHGVDHVRITTLSPEAVRRRTAGGRAELEDLTGRRLRWVRPPYGAQDRPSWSALTDGGLTCVLWGVDQEDWKPQVDDDRRLAAALTGVGPGAILLAHDGFAGPEDGAFDGPAPQLDRGALVRRVLRAYGDLGLVGRGLGQTLEHGTEVREERFPA